MQRWGLTLPLPSLPLREHADLVRRAEAAGYTDLWSGETQGPDGFTPLALAATWTDRARLGTGVVGGFTRGPAPLAQQAAALTDASDRRFELLCRFFCLPGEREQIEPLARFMFASYATVPVYEAFFRWLGYGERIDEMAAAWKAKDREAAVAAAPWEVIEDTFIFGAPEQMRERLDAYVAGGITLPVLTPITTPERLGEMIEALAPS